MNICVKRDLVDLVSKEVTEVRKKKLLPSDYTKNDYQRADEIERDEKASKFSYNTHVAESLRGME